MARRGRQAGMQAALELALGSLESADRVRQSLALAYWEQVVGPQATAATEPEAVRDGVLFVRTRSSVWSQELTFLKSHIITELNKRIGKPVVKDIVYRARGVKKRAPEAEDDSGVPTEQDLEAVKLSAEDRAAIEDELAGLTIIKDEHIRSTVGRRIVRDRRLRRWRLDHGWRVCRSCTALHREESEVCPICRLCR